MTGNHADYELVIHTGPMKILTREAEAGGDRAAFQKAIAAAPGDFTAYLVFADWLDDRGEEPSLALAMRWCAKNRQHPHRRTHYHTLAQPRRVPDKWGWGWYCRAFTDRSLLTRDRAVEGSILPRVEYLSFGGTGPHRLYPSWEAAVSGLAVGLEYMRKSVTL